MWRMHGGFDAVAISTLVLLQQLFGILVLTIGISVESIIRASVLVLLKDLGRIGCPAEWSWLAIRSWRLHLLLQTLQSQLCVITLQSQLCVISNAFIWIQIHQYQYGHCFAADCGRASVVPFLCAFGFSTSVLEIQGCQRLSGCKSRRFAQQKRSACHRPKHSAFSHAFVTCLHTGWVQSWCSPWPSPGLAVSYACWRSNLISEYAVWLASGQDRRIDRSS
jgi:hypothetical protein